MKAKNLKKQLMAAIAMTMVAVISLGSSTYAWFINNTLVTATDVTVTAQASNTLLISQGGTDGNSEDPAPIAWGTTIALETENGFKAAAETDGTEDAIQGLVPVSTIGSADGSKMEFYTSTGWTADETGYLASEFTAIAYNKEATEFYMDTFKIKAGQPCNLYLTDATDFDVNDALNKTLRLALIVKKEGAVAGETFFYEIADGEIVEDTSVNSTKQNADGLSQAVDSATSVSEILAKNAADGVKTLADGIATRGTKTIPGANGEADTIEPDSNALVIKGNDSDILYAFSDANGYVCDVTAYIWMEGCDHDCIASNVKAFTGEANKVTAQLGFGAGA